MLKKSALTNSPDLVSQMLIAMIGKSDRQKDKGDAT